MDKETPFNYKLNIIFEYYPIKIIPEMYPIFFVAKELKNSTKNRLQITIDLKQYMETLLGEPLIMLINLKH